MAFATTTFKLDLTPGASRPVIYASAGDIGRPFTASLYWNGEAWTPGTATPVIRGKKPDKTVFEYNGLTVSNNAVTFKTQEQMTIISGPVECELVFSNDGDVIASANFVLIVEESPYDPNAISESEVAGLNAMIQAATPEAVDDWFETEASSSEVFNDALNNSVTDYLDENGASAALAPVFEDTTGLYPLDWQKDKSLTINGSTVDVNNPATEANWSCCVEPCTAGDVFSVKGCGGNGTRLWGFADANGNMLSVSSAGLHTTSFVPVTAPENAAYFIANSKYTDIKGDAYKGNTYSNYAWKSIQFYPASNGNVYLEEDKTNKIVYFTFGNTPFAVRYGEGGAQFPIGRLFRNFLKPSQYSTSFNPDLYVNIEDSTGLTVVTSPSGLTECIPIQDDYSLVFDMDKTLLKVVPRYSVTRNQIVLVANDTGSIVDLHSSLQKFYTKNIVNEAIDALNMESIPSYWNNAISEAETNISNYLSSSNSASFAFVTDTHIDANRGYSGALLEKVMKECYIPAWFHGGDVVTGGINISKANLYKTIKKDFAQFEKMENRCIRTIGNHDPVYGETNWYDHNLTNTEIEQNYFGINYEKDLLVYGNSKTYYYKDIPSDKLRLISLDINNYQSQISEDGTVTGVNKVSYHLFGQAQLQWLASVLASVPVGYSVAICSHMVPVTQQEFRDAFDSNWTDSYPIDYIDARGIATAYKNKTTYSADSFTGSFDFSNAHGEIVCWIGGHSHRDCIIEKGGVNYVVTANDSISVSSSVPAYTPAKTPGTNTEQVLDFFCINKDTKTVNIVRLGAYVTANGKVRTITY